MSRILISLDFYLAEKGECDDHASAMKQPSGLSRNLPSLSWRGHGGSVLALSARADFICSIADNNKIYEINTLIPSATAIFKINLTGSSNAFAYDALRKQFFFVDDARNLKFWDGGTPTLSKAPRRIAMLAGL
ncbi:hypothetical protein KBY66_13345 [Synechococcus sp. Tobar12-5m-g]|uniref:hypothetical protein n=1 Tax=unclassified Synechococcus TaxID=2626047 RepID=UPI0020CFCF1F|nr:MULTISPECIES: hypothetical protein [unclassified Synechococcus]MCP9773586.1 hypothetical protein [Synechococcus sp. Tobar12-5m-g]MCP9874558.1 hypothetical protein [Synechococcus sp. Cruz CV-v-12]